MLHANGDYYFPDLELPPQQPLGRWARLHLRHLQAHHPTHVQRLLLTGTLSEYLHTVDQQASERYDTLMKGYAKSWEITESLKSEDPMQWVGRMQLARSEAEHNVMTEAHLHLTFPHPRPVCRRPGVGHRFSRGGISMARQTPAPIRSSAAEVLTYIASTGDPQDNIEMRYEDENIWLTQKTMARLYDVDVRTINYHIKKIFDDSELSEHSVIRKFRITASDGKAYATNHYALQMIIAVGFKVNSERAVQFRKWVNQIASQYTIRGWVMDDERLKQGTYLTDKYFEEQLERIREIRASERKFYQKITDLYATAVDYDRTAPPPSASTLRCRTRCTLRCMVTRLPS